MGGGGGGGGGGYLLPRSLAPVERKYSHIEKKVVIYGVKRVHQYVWGRPYNISISESRSVPRKWHTYGPKNHEMGINPECIQVSN